MEDRLGEWKSEKEKGGWGAKCWREEGKTERGSEREMLSIMGRDRAFKINDNNLTEIKKEC